MVRMYGNPTKLVRHMNEDEFTLEPEKMYLLNFWRHASNTPARSDGDDVQGKILDVGSRVTKHKVTLTITPETIEPQNIYIGTVKLSWNDVYSPYVCGLERDDTAHGTQSTATAVTSYFGLYPDQGFQVVEGSGAERFADGTNGDLIDDILLDDHFKHFCNLKKVTLFDQRPLMTDRWQRVPSKVKRINPYTFYGLYIYNDSVRGATPADTQITVNCKSYFEEWAI